MEGLHHDTDLDSTTKTSNGSFNASEKIQVKETDEVVPKKNLHQIFWIRQLIKACPRRKRLGCMTKWFEFGVLRKDHLGHINKEILEVSCIFTLDKRLLLLAPYPFSVRMIM